MRNLLILILVSWASPVWATYTTCTVAAPSIALDDGRVELFVTLTGDKGESSKAEFLVTTDADAKAQCVAALAKKNGGSDVLPKYTVGAVIDVATVTPPIEPPTKDQTDRAMFQAARAHLLALKSLADLGVDVATDITVAIKAVQDSYRVEFVEGSPIQ